MSHQSLDGFKPLSEEEESHVIGGNPGKPDVCAPIAQQIATLEMQIKSFPQGQHNTPAYRNMEQQLTALEQNYKNCEQKNH